MEHFKLRLQHILVIFALLTLGPAVWSQVTSVQQLPSIDAVNELATLPIEYVDFIRAEQSNDYTAKDTTVTESFRAKGLNIFRVGYIEVPRDRLDVELALEYSELISTHLLRSENGTEYVRFFIHPDSEHLYQPLIDEFGYKGYYNALATASTRSVLAWDPARRQVEPVFLKLSLAQFQDQMGRVIPGWEVRRGVRVTELLSQDKKDKVQSSKITVIPEVAGAFVKKEERLGFKVDADQGLVFDHGFILRDASFIKKFRGKMVVPLFWLFSHRGSKPPLIIELFQAEQKRTGATFEEFMQKYLFEPFVRDNLPMMLFQGIVPQIHGQNVVLVLNPTTFEIEHTLHRDIGSMKTDYRLRWIQDRPIHQLRSDLADKDFGLSWGAEKIQAYFKDYFHDWVFRWGYKSTIEKYIPGFRISATEAKLMETLKSELSRNLQMPVGKLTVTELIMSYIASKVPTSFQAASFGTQSLSRSTQAEVEEFLRLRESRKQSVPFPQTWSDSFVRTNPKIQTQGYVHTLYGIVYSKGKPGELHIAFYDRPLARSAVSPAHGPSWAGGFLRCQALFQ